MHLILQTNPEHWTSVIGTATESDGRYWVSHENAGLDIPCPMTLTIQPGQLGVKIHLGVRVQPSSHFMLVPRSSISKTPLRMSNSIGVIDKSYRGELILCVDNRGTRPYNVMQGTRLCQIVAPNMDQISFEFGMVNKDTARGEGGFGSTGK